MRIVVKLGTSTLTHSTGRLNIRRVETLCKTLSDLKNAGHEIVLVTSGAIGMGVGKLQCELMYVYDKLFSEYHHTVAQVLLTGADVRDERRRENMRNTLLRLLELQAIPVVNENDAVVTDEIGVHNTIGENDTLSAIVAELTEAELLILLSDIDGLYTADPHRDPDARLIERVEEITPALEALAGGSGSALGTGGMATKLSAAKLATAAGADMIIANGRNPELLYQIAAGEPVGTRFIAKGR